MHVCSWTELLFLSRATGACPIGSLQAVVGSWNFKMAYYVVGFLIFVGALLGRLGLRISLSIWPDSGLVE